MKVKRITFSSIYIVTIKSYYSLFCNRLRKLQVSVYLFRLPMSGLNEAGMPSIGSGELGQSSPTRMDDQMQMLD